jgi:alpha-L-rhamnosidase
MTQNSQVDPRRREFLLPTRIVWQTTGDAAPLESSFLLTSDTGQAPLEAHPYCTIPRTDQTSSLLLDFGQELNGGVQIVVGHASRSVVGVRIRFGESVSEAMGEPNGDHANHDLMFPLVPLGTQEIGNTGFRFVRLDFPADTLLHLVAVRAVSLQRPLEYLGTFECSDKRINEIWQTGARTVHLCMQEYVWDGIKRDRLVWIGDLHPETMVIASVFGGHPIVPATLDYQRERSPLPDWMNGISSYSLWWLLIQRDWYRYQGDLSYLQLQREYLTGLLALIDSKVDAEGQEHLDGMRFLEWPTSGDPTAIDAGLQALVVLALQAGAELCSVLADPDASARALSAAQRAASFQRPASSSKQANALMAMSGMAEASTVNRDILALDPYRGLSTFYGYYVLQARALAGDYAGCLDLLRTYWGGMLDMGATTFWEGFEVDWMENSARIDEMVLPGKRDIHADFGGYCYVGLRHSLCHGWAAGPTAWLMEHVLGIAPASPGFATVTVTPHLAGLTYARGTFPTPHGIIQVSHERGADGEVITDLKLPDGVCLVTG